MEAAGCFCGIWNSRHWEIKFSWKAPHTHHYLTNIWQEKYPSWLKAVRLCDVCFCWWHVSFPVLSSCMDMLTFSSELACVCCGSMSPVWLAAVPFRCSLFSCSLIRAEAPAAAGRKPCSRKCLPDTVQLWPQCQSDIYSSEEKENRHSHPQSFPNPVTVK